MTIMRYIDIDELKKIQCEVLVAIDNYCHENNIKYSIACGTLLGAIRHKGYIPWDDDIDIYVLRKDYERLVEMFPQSYVGHISLMTYERTNGWNRTYAKAVDNRTIFKEYTGDDIEMGIGIDIFPIDNVPNDEEEWKRYDRRRRRLQNWKYSLKDSRLLKNNKERPIYKTIVLALTRWLLFWLPSRLLCKYLDKIAQQYNGENCHYVFENSLGILCKKRFRKDVFEQIVRVPFESYEFDAFANYDEYLSNAYGNYMQLPPKEKQVSHHEFKAWWKNE